MKVRKTSRFFGEMYVFLGKWDFGMCTLLKEAGASVQSSGLSTHDGRHDF